MSQITGALGGVSFGPEPPPSVMSQPPVALFTGAPGSMVTPGTVVVGSAVYSANDPALSQIGIAEQQGLRDWLAIRAQINPPRSERV